MTNLDLEEKIVEIYEKNHQKHKDCNTRSGECACEVTEFANQLLSLFKQWLKENLPEEVDLDDKYDNEGKQLAKRLGIDTSKTPEWMRERRYGYNQALKDIKEVVKGQK